MSIAVLGATGLIGTAICGHLRDLGAQVVPLSRAAGLDLVSGDGLTDALRGVDVVIDASRPVPRGGESLVDQMTAASENLVAASGAAGIERLVFVSIVGVDNRAVAQSDYYAAKRVQERVIEGGTVPSTIVRSTQWYEFATNPAAVDVRLDEVLVQDWLIQPVAVDSVARTISELALRPTESRVVAVAGPEIMRLPALTERTLRADHDLRPVRVVPPPVGVLGEGGLLPAGNALIAGPDLTTWLSSRR